MMTFVSNKQTLLQDKQENDSTQRTTKTKSDFRLVQPFSAEIDL
jgi:hypothetical protein